MHINQSQHKLKLQSQIMFKMLIFISVIFVAVFVFMVQSSTFKWHPFSMVIVNTNSVSDKIPLRFVVSMVVSWKLVKVFKYWATATNFDLWECKIFQCLSVLKKELKYIQTRSIWMEAGCKKATYLPVLQHRGEEVLLKRIYYLATSIHNPYSSWKGCEKKSSWKAS